MASINPSIRISIMDFSPMIKYRQEQNSDCKECSVPVDKGFKAPLSGQPEEAVECTSLDTLSFIHLPHQACFNLTDWPVGWPD
jgi:hypothetical protein